MGDIDGISEALGELKTGISYIREDASQTRNLMASMDGKIDGLAQDRILHESKISALHSRMDKIEPRVETHDTIIGRVIWLGSLVITGVTLLLNWAGPFLSRVFH